MKLRLDITHRHTMCDECGPITHSQYDLYMDDELIATERGDNHMGGDVEWSHNQFGIIKWIVSEIPMQMDDTFDHIFVPTEEGIVKRWFGDMIEVNRKDENEN